MSTTTKNTQPRSSRARRIAKISGFLALYALLLFLSAGTFDWPRAWIFIGSFAATLTVSGVVVHKTNPGLIDHRGEIEPDTKKFDKVFYTVSLPLFLIMAVGAGFDAVRFHWSSMPVSLVAVGIALSVPAHALVMWAMATNAHFESTVRIQKERGHRVCTGGPYTYVRHPGYVGMIFMYTGMPLILGSWWAFVPICVIIVLVVIRTGLEDRTLHRELPGYSAYAKKTRFRLLPGIW